MVLGKRIPGHGQSLTFQNPMYDNGRVVVKLDKEDVDSEAILWVNTLIGFVYGQASSYTQMQAFVKRQWTTIQSP